eukprot:1665277-Rhodomonas_salina.1
MEKESSSRSKEQAQDSDRVHSKQQSTLQSCAARPRYRWPPPAARTAPGSAESRRSIADVA